MICNCGSLDGLGVTPLRLLGQMEVSIGLIWLIEPVVVGNGTDLWPEADDPVMLPPDVKKRSGRPKKARRRELEEVQDPTKLSKRGVKLRCSGCGKVGHDKRRCKKV